jgi:hypothetical protein
MSASGPKRTCRSPHRMSAFGGRADVSHAVFYEYTPFCNGPDDVKPPEYVTPPSSCFCPWSTPGRHIMLSEGAVSLSRYA